MREWEAHQGSDWRREGLCVRLGIALWRREPGDEGEDDDEDEADDETPAGWWRGVVLVRWDS